MKQIFSHKDCFTKNTPNNSQLIWSTCQNRQKHLGHYWKKPLTGVRSLWLHWFNTYFFFFRWTESVPGLSSLRVQRRKHSLLVGLRRSQKRTQPWSGRRKSTGNLRRLRLNFIAKRGKNQQFFPSLNKYPVLH